MPFIAFSPGIGLSLGHGAALYVGLTMSIFIGPTAFATPPVLSILAREAAVVVPSANAMLFDTNPLREDDDDDAGIEILLEED